MPGRPRCLNESALVQVTDVDEEVTFSWLTTSAGVLLTLAFQIFQLYTRLAKFKSQCREQQRDTYQDDQDGLGFLNSKTSTLTIQLPITSPRHQPPPPPDRRRRRRRAKTETEVEQVEPRIVVDCVLQQDLRALQHERGNTSSVVWKSSVRLAQLLLSTPTILDIDVSNCSNVLELGAGTGSLPILSKSLVNQVTRWVVSDQLKSLNLLVNNLKLNGLERVQVFELDWTHYESLWLTNKRSQDEWDIVFVVDCIYNEHLILPLLRTMDYVCHQNTCVVVVFELRSCQVMQEFLTSWFKFSNWQIWKPVVSEETEDVWSILGPRFGIWLAWKENT